ncbi:MAG: phosphatidylglycerophosphatase A [Deltaproteobacteria bacterium]|nr:phosphatidylglycerophosphatase A [Deltaproteobacteria bacterium]
MDTTDTDTETDTDTDTDTDLNSTTPSDRLPFSKAFQEADGRGRLALVLSCWFGAGLIPRAPGTAGTVAALPAVLLVHAAGPWPGALITLGFAVLAAWGAGAAERILGRPDPAEVVSDEVAGFMVTMVLLPFTWPFLAGGFVLFRLLDILKPFPIRWFERAPGGAGVVLDDVAAGILANLILRGTGSLLGGL